jgi:hypothetical protein
VLFRRDFTVEKTEKRGQMWYDVVCRTVYTSGKVETRTAGSFQSETVANDRRKALERTLGGDR